ncbi:hypothetical protein NAI57_10580 [Francisella tularensis subsp. holarctica]|nr:hypothetical protein [Francisella tularensis subsp. holarctica]
MRPDQHDSVMMFTEKSLQDLTEADTAQIDTDNQNMLANFAYAQKYRAYKYFTYLMGVSQKLSKYTTLLIRCYQ